MLWRAVSAAAPPWRPDRANEFERAAESCAAAAGVGLSGALLFNVSRGRLELHWDAMRRAATAPEWERMRWRSAHSGLASAAAAAAAAAQDPHRWHRGRPRIARPAQSVFDVPEMSSVRPTTNKRPAPSNALRARNTSTITIGRGAAQRRPVSQRARRGSGSGSEPLREHSDT